jgi:hypothetical protein
MWNMYMPPYFPYPPNAERQQDPISMLRKFDKFLRKEENKKKKDEGKKASWTDVQKVALLLILGMPITGPLYILCMTVMWKLVQQSLH